MEIWRKGRGIELIAAVIGFLAVWLWCHPALAAENGDDAGLDTYDIGEITVEAKRPDWEEKLSPGTVTVIRPEEFKGEQKTVTVPGESFSSQLGRLASTVISPMS